jgi:excisionase family DNA binding protein
MSDEHEFIGVTEAARIAGVSTRLLKYMAATKRITHLRTGPRTKFRFRRADVLAWVESMMVVARPPESDKSEA